MAPSESVWTSYQQCDQIARLFIQYWAIYSNANLPERIKNAQVNSKFCQILSIAIKIWKKTSNICQNDNILLNLVSLRISLLPTLLVVMIATYLLPNNDDDLKGPILKNIFALRDSDSI